MSIFWPNYTNRFETSTELHADERRNRQLSKHLFYAYWLKNSLWTWLRKTMDSDVNRQRLGCSFGIFQVIIPTIWSEKSFFEHHFSQITFFYQEICIFDEFVNLRCWLLWLWYFQRKCFAHWMPTTLTGSKSCIILTIFRIKRSHLKN